jgi:DNA-nicking Smr family endonuclease
MSKKPHITEEERALFRAAVKHVIPLSPSPARQAPPRQHIQKEKNKRVKIRERENPLLEKESPTYVSSVTSEAMLQSVRPGIQTRVMQRLKRGDFEVEAVLDLHGFSLVEAEQELHDFLACALSQDWHCVQIIHGKGKNSSQPPLLKNSVNQWLRTYPAVLAFCSAKPSDGGAGAVYVLLQRI